MNTQQGVVSATWRNDDPNLTVVVFNPIARTDGNFYASSLASLHAIWGEERGLILLEHAQKKYDERLKGFAYCWRIWNPDETFCSLPVFDEESKKLFSLYVWTQ